MYVRSGYVAGCTDLSDHITGVDMLTCDRDDLAHVSIDCVELLIFITKVHANHHRLSVVIVMISRRTCE